MRVTLASIGDAVISTDAEARVTYLNAVAEKLTGWISDDMCGAKNAQEGGGECASRCVKEHGAKYVFVDESDKKVYSIDAQDRVAPHAGHHVVVKGTVDGSALKLTSIEMAK